MQVLIVKLHEMGRTIAILPVNQSSIKTGLIIKNVKLKSKSI